MACMERVDAALVQRALNELERLDGGTCLILKRGELMTKTSYLRSWRRKAFTTVNYNLARLTLNWGVKDSSLETPGISA
jgi:hypothetical protein